MLGTAPDKKNLVLSNLAQSLTSRSLQTRGELQTVSRQIDYSIWGVLWRRRRTQMEVN